MLGHHTNTLLTCLCILIALSISFAGCVDKVDDSCSDCEKKETAGNCVADTSYAPAVNCRASGHGTYNYENCKCECSSGWTGADCSTPTSFTCPSTVTDVEGNVYEVVEIANRCWTKQNLKTTRYNDNTAIATALSDSAWENTTSGAYAVYNDNASNLSLGRLYNWYAVQTGKLCPAGWSLPSKTDFEALEAEVSGSGAKLKDTSTWPARDSATNTTGFTALAAGVKETNGSYSGNTITKFWSRDTGSSYNLPVILGLQAYSNFIDIGYIERVNGCSCRCVKD